ncbi:MAG: gene transfer agent family protein [Celeribacter marinus]
MANPFQGEVALTLNDERRVLKLTLGALAELEAGLQTDTLVALVERYEAGKFSSADVVRVVVAGLRGGGWQGGYDDILTADITGGPLEAARVGAALLARAFTVPS